MENKAKDFLKNEVLKMENRMFWGCILGSSIGYLLITLWLNSIRATASLWFVWVLIIIQFTLYFSIFIAGYQRSKVFGLNNNLALVLFIILAVLGRVNDWEMVVIPLLVIVMLVFSARNKNVSDKGQAILLKNETPESKMSDSEMKNQRDMAEKLFENDPGLAMHIAMGEEKSPKGILSAAVYAKVCDEAEKAVYAEVKDSPEYIKKLEICMELGNSDNNREISAEAQRLEFRNPDSAIEKMKEVVNARREAFKKTLPKGKTVEDIINEEAHGLKKYLIFLENYAQAILNTEKEIETKIEQIEINTKQDLKKERLAKELWILRYAFLYLWFFNIKPPKDQDELTENIKLITHAFQNVLNNANKSDYLSWLTKGLTEYTGTNQLEYKDLKEFESHFIEQVSKKIPLIAFECTEGRFAGEQYDSVIELIQTTIENDISIRRKIQEMP